MPVVVKRNTLSGLLVEEAVRKQVVSLHHEKSLAEAVAKMNKHKINSVLVADDKMQPTGVVSKTDIMGAYYASLPIDSPLNYIMSSPPVLCRRDDLLENALDKMQSNKINRLYVTGEITDQIVGILAYSDIVGLLYQYCHRCKQSKVHQGKSNGSGIAIERYRAKDVMNSCSTLVGEDDPLSMVMEVLSANRYGVVVVTDSLGNPCGMVSKTDLLSSFNKGVSADAGVKTIMSKELISCEEDEYLEMAIRKMVHAEVQSLFVYKNISDNFSGVLSLSDTTRVRSGSCHACLTSRIRVDKHC